MALKFSIITPSFRQLEWLKLCVKSIEDQKSDVELEHIIQDAGTGPELEEWVTRHSSAKLFVEKDNGMYDAVNRGLRRSTGDILAYLNCDEQYLPGALKSVETYFENHPEADILVGDYILVDHDGNFLSARKTIPPLKIHTQLCHLSILTCALFFRRKIIEKYSIYFDPNLKDVSDAQWVIDCLKQGIPIHSLKKFTSVFAFTKNNRCQQEQAKKEKSALAHQVPLHLRLSKPFILVQHRFRKLIAGAYCIKPFTYEIYTQKPSPKRVLFQVSHPNPFWRAK